MAFKDTLRKEESYYSNMTSAPDVNDFLRLELEDLVAGICKAFNDPKRLMVLYALKDNSHTVGELSQILNAPQSNTSQHLAILRDRGLIESSRQGNNVIYSLRHPRIVEAIDILRSVMNDEISRQQSLRSPR